MVKSSFSGVDRKLATIPVGNGVEDNNGGFTTGSSGATSLQQNFGVGISRVGEVRRFFRHRQGGEGHRACRCASERWHSDHR